MIVYVPCPLSNTVPGHICKLRSVMHACMVRKLCLHSHILEIKTLSTGRGGWTYWLLYPRALCKIMKCGPFLHWWEQKKLRMSMCTCCVISFMQNPKHNACLWVHTSLESRQMAVFGKKYVRFLRTLHCLMLQCLIMVSYAWLNWKAPILCSSHFMTSILAYGYFFSLGRMQTDPQIEIWQQTKGQWGTDGLIGVTRPWLRVFLLEQKWLQGSCGPEDFLLAAPPLPYHP